MSKSLENAVRYEIDLNFVNGLRLFESNPVDRLDDLNFIIEKVVEYKSRVIGVLDERTKKDILNEMFPRNIVADMYKNPFGLKDDLVGRYVGVEVKENDLKILGLVEKKRKKSSFRKRNIRRAFDFKGKVEYLPEKITYDCVFELYEKYGLAHELKSYGVDIERAYKRVLISRKMEEYEGVDEFSKNLHYVLNHVGSILIFCMRIEAEDFVGDPEKHLENTYEMFLPLVELYRDINNVFAYYREQLHEREMIGWGNYSDSDISHVESVAYIWEMSEERLYERLDEYMSSGNDEGEALVTRYLSTIGSDKCRIDELKDDKLFEKEILKQNYNYEMSRLQRRIRKDLGILYRECESEIIGWKDLSDGIFVPDMDDFGEIENVEFDPDDAKLLEEIRDKYLEFFLDEIDVEAIFEAIKAEGINDVDFWDYLNKEKVFEDEVENLKLRIFMEEIVWIALGPSAFIVLSSYLGQLYEAWSNLPVDISDCDSIEDYVGVWSSKYSDEKEKSLAAERICEIVATIDMLSLEKEVRDVVLNVLSQKEENETVKLTDYCLDESQKVLNLRQIDAFMKVLGAKKEQGLGSHVKYSISVHGLNHSYTIPKSTVKNGKFHALLLLQNIYVENGEPREVQPLFAEILKQAFRKIGVEMQLKT